MVEYHLRTRCPLGLPRCCIERSLRLPFRATSNLSDKSSLRKQMSASFRQLSPIGVRAQTTKRTRTHAYKQGWCMSCDCNHHSSLWRHCTVSGEICKDGWNKGGKIQIIWGQIWSYLRTRACICLNPKLLSEVIEVTSSIPIICPIIQTFKFFMDFAFPSFKSLACDRPMRVLSTSKTKSMSFPRLPYASTVKVFQVTNPFVGTSFVIV